MFAICTPMQKAENRKPSGTVYYRLIGTLKPDIHQVSTTQSA